MSTVLPRLHLAWFWLLDCLIDRTFSYVFVVGTIRTWWTSLIKCWRIWEKKQSCRKAIRIGFVFCISFLQTRIFPRKRVLVDWLALVDRSIDGWIDWLITYRSSIFPLLVTSHKYDLRRIWAFFSVYFYELLWTYVLNIVSECTL